MINKFKRNNNNFNKENNTNGSGISIVENELNSLQQTIKLSPNQLSSYLSYISYIQSLYPKLSTLSSYEKKLSLKHINDLQTFICNTLEQFSNDVRYCNNIKYLKLWILYADITNNHDLIFKQLTRLKIGLNHSLFYQHKALIYEKKGQYQLADQIYMNGMKANAQPLLALINAYDLFKKRWNNQNNKKKLEKKYYHINILTNNNGIEQSFEEYRALIYKKMKNNQKKKK